MRSVQFDGQPVTEDEESQYKREEQRVSKEEEGELVSVITVTVVSCYVPDSLISVHIELYQNMEGHCRLHGIDTYALSSRYVGREE